MNTLLRIYLVLIFASSALNAGSENDSINSGIPIEASNFTLKPNYPQHLEELAACMNSSNQKKENAIFKAISENVSEEITTKELSK